MKKLLLLSAFAIALFCSSQEASAFSAKCSMVTLRINGMSKNAQFQFEPGDMVQAGVWSKAMISCKTRKGTYMRGTVDFVGPALMTEATYGNNLFMTCPLVSEKRLVKRLKAGKKFTITGGDFAVGIAAGIRGGLSVNERGAFCTYGAPIFALGANAGFTVIHLKSVESFDDYAAYGIPADDAAPVEMQEGQSDEEVVDPRL